MSQDKYKVAFIMLNTDETTYIVSSILIILAAVIIATITAEESMAEASATTEQCDSNGEDNTTCTYKQQHSNDFTLSNSVKSEK